MENMVKAAEIYKAVQSALGYQELDESLTRNLRNKMNFLMEQVALRKVSEFKKGRDIFIPVNDAAIIRNLLMLAICDDDMVYDWFNGNIDTSKAENSILLYWQLEEPITKAAMTGETDSVTVDEWLATIRGVIGFDMAKKTVQMKRKLEDFRLKTLVLDSTVRTGDIFAHFENGSRQYISERCERNTTLSNELLDKVVEKLYLQEDYFDALNQIFDRMIVDAESKAIPVIKKYALMKKVAECDKVRDLIDTKDMSIVSEYYPWFQKISEYLNKHPEETKKLEATTNTEGLQEFFRIK